MNATPRLRGMISESGFAPHPSGKMPTRFPRSRIASDNSSPSRLSCPLVATGTMPPASSIAIRFHHRLPVVSAAARLDHALCEANVEYETKRESLRLDGPLLRIVAPGTFDAYRQERVSGGAPEAQVKVPHLTPDREFGKQFTVIREIEQVAS